MERCFLLREPPCFGWVIDLDSSASGDDTISRWKAKQFLKTAERRYLLQTCPLNRRGRPAETVHDGDTESCLTHGFRDDGIQAGFV